MPTVPTEQNRSGIASTTDVKLQPGDYSGTGLQALGAGMQQLGQVGREVAQQRQEILETRDDAETKKAFNAFMAERDGILRTGPDAFFRQQGLNATAALPAVRDQLTKLSERLSSSLTTNRQRGMFRDALTVRMNDDLADMAAHAQAQQAVEDARQSTLMIDTLRREAVAESNDSNRFEATLASAAHEFNAQARKQGWAANVAASYFATWRSGVQADIVKNKMGDDPIGAAAYYEAHIDGLLPDERVELQAALKGPLAERRAEANVDYLLDAAPANGANSKPLGDEQAQFDRVVAITNLARGENREKLDRRRLVELAARYSGDPEKIWAAYRQSAATVDAAIRRRGEAWRSALSPTTHDYVGMNMAMLRGEGMRPSPYRTPQHDALPDLYLKIERLPISGAEKAATAAALSARIRDAENNRARLHKAAQDDALTTADSLREQFVSLNQLSADTRRDMPEGARRALIARARQNRLGKPIPQDSDAVITLNRLAVEDKPAFAATDLRLFKHEVPLTSFQALTLLQQQIRADPLAPSSLTHDRVFGIIDRTLPDASADGRLARAHGPDIDLQRRKMRIASIMKADLAGLTGDKRQPSAEEIEGAFDRAIIDVERLRPLHLRGADIPGRARAQIVSAYRQRYNRRPTEDELLEAFSALTNAGGVSR